ncbi:hypothetical protein [Mesorhizobium sp. M0139]|uniref:hypothetical protein n=1 Tax=Mesorhizobium sp. M0139 TaxID=2956892 RepID=UPI00333D1FD2
MTLTVRQEESERLKALLRQIREAVSGSIPPALEDMEIAQGVIYAAQAASHPGPFGQHLRFSPRRRDQEL